MKRFAVIFVVLALAGCGGGGDGEAHPSKDNPGWQRGYDAAMQLDDGYSAGWEIVNGCESLSGEPFGTQETMDESNFYVSWDAGCEAAARDIEAGR